MRLIIDISEYNAKYIKNAYGIPHDINMIIAEAIINGKQIPTPHGRLGDLDKLKAQYVHGKGNDEIESAWISNIRRAITKAPTVIEAED